MKTLKLSNTIGRILMTRNAVINLFEEFANPNKIVLDFKNIEFVSRSAAHEYLRQKSSRNIIIKEINMSQNVKAMFVLVLKQLKKIAA